MKGIILAGGTGLAPVSAHQGHQQATLLPVGREPMNLPSGCASFTRAASRRSWW